MILGFSTEFPWGEPTNFVENIKSGQKIHTIREDKNRRWREGMKIHFATGVRTPDYNQFYEGVCTGVQDVMITQYKIFRFVLIQAKDQPKENKGRVFYNTSKVEFAVNDGFESVDDLFRWFNPEQEERFEFKGRIIHWTDKRY